MIVVFSFTIEEQHYSIELFGEFVDLDILARKALVYVQIWDIGYRNLFRTHKI